MASTTKIATRAKGVGFPRRFLWIRQGTGRIDRIDFLTIAGVTQFESAADAVVAGDTAGLQSLLQAYPELAHARSTRAHGATLLHYLGANGVEEERQRTPVNAVEIAAMLLDAGANVDAVAHIYGSSTTIGLVATSVHPRRAGVQIALLELLLQHGAAVDGVPGHCSPLVAALRNGRSHAAEFLARHGAQLDIEAAAGLGRLDLVECLCDGTRSPKLQMEAGFLWACEYGRNAVVEFLLGKGVSPNAQAGTGLPGLHWAVVGAQSETIRLLLRFGASLELRNVHRATALGQAVWLVVNGDPEVDYVPAIEVLVAAGALVNQDWLEWLPQQTICSGSEKARVMDSLRMGRAEGL